MRLRWMFAALQSFLLLCSPVVDDNDAEMYSMKCI